MRNIIPYAKTAFVLVVFPKSPPLKNPRSATENAGQRCSICFFADSLTVSLSQAVEASVCAWWNGAAQCGQPT